MTVATALLDPTADRPGRASRVLLVDRDAVTRRAMAGALRAAGLAVTAVAADDQALAVLVSVQPDVLVTDLRANGLELVRTLRVREVDVPALAVGERMDRVAAFQAGADDFLATPFGPAELLSRVAELAYQRG
jgi:two-component system KDP operon response regulator KdpE